jgi:hypothetical protein
VVPPSKIKKQLATVRAVLVMMAMVFFRAFCGLPIRNIGDTGAERNAGD